MDFCYDNNPTLRVSVCLYMLFAVSANAPLWIVRLSVPLFVTSSVSFLLLYAFSHLPRNYWRLFPCVYIANKAQ